MAVYLLNCQLRIENRPTFECEDSMTIGRPLFWREKSLTTKKNVLTILTFIHPGECTSTMDGTSWNAYQITANRARAVCYQTRQQIFRIKTEAAVNRLVQTSHEQISGMEKLREDQEKLGQVCWSRYFLLCYCDPIVQFCLSGMSRTQQLRLCISPTLLPLPLPSSNPVLPLTPFLPQTPSLSLSPFSLLLFSSPTPR